MKKSLLIFTIFILVAPFLKAQNNSYIKNVIAVDGEYAISGKSLIYQLKDSTIQIIPYKYRNVFHGKTPDELAALNWQMEDGHLGDEYLGIPMQEYAIETVDVISVRHRAARGRNMIIGMAIGLAGTIIYLNSRDLHEEAFDDYPDWESILFPPIGIGLGAIVGMSIPTLGKRFRINRSKEKYEEQKELLGKYAIIK